MEIFTGVDVPLYLVFLVLTGLLVYVYASWPYGQFQKLGLSGPPPQLFFGNQRQLLAKSAFYSLSRWFEQYGRVYGIYLCRDPLIVVSDLDILRTVLVKDFGHFTDRHVLNRSAQSSIFQRTLPSSRGADWKRIRAIITPTFSAGKLRQMEPQINHCSRDLTFNLMQKAKDGHKVNVKEYFGAYTLDVIASTAFGLQVDSQKDLTEPFLVNVKAMLGGVRTFHFFNALLAVLPFLAPAVRWLRSWPLFSKPAAFYTDSIRSMVQQRKGRDGNDRSTPVDFLQLLVNAEDTENTIESHKRLTLEEVESQMILFFVAGYETTGSTLQYLAYSLAMHPDIQERVVAEIQQELGEETPTYDNVSKLKYMDHAIHETLRLYPPVSQVTREASETITIRELTIPRGFGVLVPVQIVMRDPDYFPDPARFNPDRFSDKASMDPISFLAFGQGPRQCVGMRLAMLEIKVAMVHVLRQIRFVRTPDMPETLQFKAGVGSLQYLTAPLLVKVVPRNADQ